MKEQAWKKHKQDTNCDIEHGDEHYFHWCDGFEAGQKGKIETAESVAFGVKVDERLRVVAEIKKELCFCDSVATKKHLKKGEVCYNCQVVDSLGVTHK